MYYFGAHGLVVGERSSAPFSPTVNKASSGALDIMADSIFYTRSLSTFVKESLRYGWTVVSASPPTASISDHPPLSLDKMHMEASNSVSLSQFSKLTEPILLIMGNESVGISSKLLNQSSCIVSIPSFRFEPKYLPFKVDSLNVSAALAVLLSHLYLK